MKLWIAVISILAVAGSVLSQDKSEKAAKLVRLSFFYDANLNGRKDHGEPRLTDLKSSASGHFQKSPDGSVLVPGKQRVTLQVSGIGPAGKPLTIATHLEPVAVTMLPEFTYPVGESDAVIGLADGYLTSPIRSGQMKMEDYNSVLRNPAGWKAQSDPLYPRGWSYDRNYYFFGYRIPSGGLKGTAHLAFDIWAEPGTPVLASAPGKITEPLFDWRFGISGPYGTVYYNHIIPSVKIGDMVKRYDVVGYIARDQGDHVHFEIRPDPSAILEAFPGVDRSYFLKSPLRGESVPVPPFFGPE